MPAAIGFLGRGRVANACIPAIACASLVTGCAGKGKATIAADAAGDPSDGPDANVDPIDPGPDPDPRKPLAWAVSASLIHVRWQPNTESDLAGYKVYRDDSQFAIALVQRNITTYEDRDVLPAKTYTYNLTAFDAAGNESVQSPTLRATTPPGVMPPLSFATDVFPILQAQCASCHSAYVDLASAYTLLTSVGNGPCAGRRMMIPGNALRSLVFQTVTGSQDCGPALPAGALQSAQARIVGAWINQGGLNN